MLLPRPLDNFVKSILAKKGYIQARDADTVAMARRMRLFDSQKTDLLIDVGANVGQYGLQARRLGYKKRIVSFEPMTKAWEALKENANKNAPWDTFQHALGDVPNKETINISQNSISSSILEMDAKHYKHAPDSKYVSTEEITIKRLDDCFPAFYEGEENIWLKIDVQGFEDRVLTGGKSTLKKCRIVQLELSLTQLYKNQSSFLSMLNRMDSNGFDLIGVEPGFQEADSGALLQLDGIFKNREL